MPSTRSWQQTVWNTVGCTGRTYPSPHNDFDRLPLPTCLPPPWLLRSYLDAYRRVLAGDYIEVGLACAPTLAGSTVVEVGDNASKAQPLPKLHQRMKHVNTDTDWGGARKPNHHLTLEPSRADTMLAPALTTRRVHDVAHVKRPGPPVTSPSHS